MRFTTTSLAILALSQPVLSQGIIDNLEVALGLKKAAVTLKGDYYVQNAKTKKFLSFNRPGDTTNLHTSDTKATITITHGSASGMSGKVYGDYTGSIITGMSKCASAQFNDGLDTAFVSYACSVGDNPTGTDTLEVAKQFWRIVPCGDNSDDDSSSSVGVQLAVKQSSSDSASDAEFESASKSSAAEVKATTTKKAEATAAAATSKAFDVNDRSTWDCKHDGKWLSRHPDYITTGGHVECKDELVAWRAANPDWDNTDGVISSDRSTWVCRHEGKWLNRHPKYVIKNTECKEELAAYRKSLKKRTNAPAAPSHAKMARNLKRASTDGRYCILAVDHETDMVSRAVGSGTLTTVGDYLSQQLVDYDANDESQHWDIYAA